MYLYHILFIHSSVFCSFVCCAALCAQPQGKRSQEFLTSFPNVLFGISMLILSYDATLISLKILLLVILNFRYYTISLFIWGGVSHSLAINY